MIIPALENFPSPIPTLSLIHSYIFLQAPNCIVREAFSYSSHPIVLSCCPWQSLLNSIKCPSKFYVPHVHCLAWELLIQSLLPLRKSLYFIMTLKTFKPSSVCSTVLVGSSQYLPYKHPVFFFFYYSMACHFLEYTMQCHIMALHRLVPKPESIFAPHWPIKISPQGYSNVSYSVRLLLIYDLSFSS